MVNSGQRDPNGRQVWPTDQMYNLIPGWKREERKGITFSSARSPTQYLMCVGDLNYKLVNLCLLNYDDDDDQTTRGS